MWSNNPEEVEAMRHLEKIVDDLGLAHVVYLPADMAERQSDLLFLNDGVKAARLAHDAKLLARTAIPR